MKLKTKLLLAAILLLLFPVATVQFLRSLDRWLVEKDRLYLEQRAQNLATGLAPFITQWSNSSTLTGFPVFPLEMVNQPILDGYDDEWKVNSINWINFKNSKSRLLISKNAHYYYLFIESPLTRKSQIKYKLLFNAKTNSLATAPGQFIYRINPETQGKIQVYNSQKKWLSRIQGYWRSQGKASSLELRIPIDLFSAKLKVFIMENGVETVSPKMQILKSNALQQKLLNNIALGQGEKLWLLGRTGEVLGVKGDLEESSKLKTNALLTWLIGSVPVEVKDPWSGSSQIPQQWLTKAAINGVNSRIEPGVNSNQKRIVAVAKIAQGEDISGYILFEKVSGSSLLLSQPQVGRLINITLGIMILTILSLVIFSGRLAWRIERLKKQFSDSLDPHGRVLQVLSASNDKDEIGQLSVEIKNILERQKNYQDYQERLASRLSHELRTPMAVVRGALDNLTPLFIEDGGKYQVESIALVARATLGIERMSSLVRRMREAARLELSINNMVKEPMDVHKLLQETIPGLAAVWRDRTIAYQSKAIAAEAMIAADLVVQALEKLLSNAVDFAQKHTDISVTLELKTIQLQHFLVVSVINFGPQLATKDAQHLLENMVSLRENEAKTEPHLGLGLHIVHLIAKFHGGVATISNLQNGQGVRASFSIKIK